MLSSPSFLWCSGWPFLSSSYRRQYVNKGGDRRGHISEELDLLRSYGIHSVCWSEVLQL